jgi:hypothetical protein
MFCFLELLQFFLGVCFHTLSQQDKDTLHACRKMRNECKILVRKPKRRIHLPQDRVQWWIVVNMVMNIRFHKIWEIS